MTSVAIFAEAMLGWLCGLCTAERGGVCRCYAMAPDMNHSGSGVRIRHSCLPRMRRDWLRSRDRLLTWTCFIQHPQIVQRMSVGTKTPPVPQVGGHAGVSTSEDGSLLIKPALAHEVDFYQHLNSEPSLAALRPYIPKFYGTLRLEGKVEGGNLETLRRAPKEGKDKCLFDWETGQGIARVFMTTIHSIVLENLANIFLKPNILDIKLGTRLYDDEASEEKRARMEKAAAATTSLTTGIRLTGFQVSQYAMALRFFVEIFSSFHLPF